MTNQQAQNIIVQGLNSINTFYSQDLQLEEIDLSINTSISLLIRTAFKIEPEITQRGIVNAKGYGLEDIQLREDDFKSLKVKDLEILGVPIGANTLDTGVFVSLPIDYFHLVNNRSKITFSCGKRIQTSVVRNRLNTSEDLHSILENSIYGPRKESPVSDIQGNNLYVYTDGTFTIKSVLMDYIKNPVVVDTVNNPNQVMQFADDFCNVITSFTVRLMSIQSQQDPQKIAFMKQENIR